MRVDQRIVEGNVHLDYKYIIQSGPTKIQSYGLALAKCLRFPSTMLDRADELIREISDESYIDFNKTINASKMKHVNQTRARNDETMQSVDVSTFAQGMTELEKDVIDLYSYVLLLMSSDKNRPEAFADVEMINQMLKSLIEKMSPEFRELINNSSLTGILSTLNATMTPDQFQH